MSQLWHSVAICSWASYWTYLTLSLLSQKDEDDNIYIYFDEVRLGTIWSSGDHHYIYTRVQSECVVPTFIYSFNKYQSVHCVLTLCSSWTCAVYIACCLSLLRYQSIHSRKWVFGCQKVRILMRSYIGDYELPVWEEEARRNVSCCSRNMSEEVFHNGGGDQLIKCLWESKWWPENETLVLARWTSLVIFFMKGGRRGNKYLVQIKFQEWTSCIPSSWSLEFCCQK